MKKDEIPNIVREFKVGNTRIKIADNYCRDKTREEVVEALAEIARTAQAYLSADAETEKKAG